jgi:hypothetical protein
MPTAAKPSAVDTYRTALRELDTWDGYLREQSRLPGPRANLELLEAVIREGNRARFAHWLELDAAALGGAPPNTPDEFLTVCGVAGLGALVAAGDQTWLEVLRPYASDRRWRVREAVAIALQHWGDGDMAALTAEMGEWSAGSWLERRAVVAALAEPRLLAATPQFNPAPAVLAIFDTITDASVAASDRKDEGYQVLRQALGYAWSVLVAADPETCRAGFERRLLQAEATGDKDLTWICRQNLAKNRLVRLDPAWAAAWSARLA